MLVDQVTRAAVHRPAGEGTGQVLAYADRAIHDRIARVQNFVHAALGLREEILRKASFEEEAAAHDDLGDLIVLVECRGDSRQRKGHGSHKQQVPPHYSDPAFRFCLTSSDVRARLYTETRWTSPSQGRSPDSSLPTESRYASFQLDSAPPPVVRATSTPST